MTQNTLTEMQQSAVDAAKQKLIDDMVDHLEEVIVEVRTGNVDGLVVLFQIPSDSSFVDEIREAVRAMKCPILIAGAVLGKVNDETARGSLDNLLTNRDEIAEYKARMEDGEHESGQPD